ncbi:MAG: hypothetical protein PHI48_04005 [Bacteroidales bacterium]|nr:hypothetical protein [Bacteroidales bacterium]
MHFKVVAENDILNLFLYVIMGLQIKQVKINSKSLMLKQMLMNLEESDLDKPIYRIISIERLLEMFKFKELIFPQVKEWDDVYENFFIKSKFRDMNGEVFEIDDDLEEYYGQCWSFTKDSDALWRIVSVSAIPSCL